MTHSEALQPFAVIFDMDGVIVDSNPAHKIALKAFCKQHGYDLSDREMIAKIYGRTNKDWIANLFRNQLTWEEQRKFAAEKEQLFREIYEKDIKPVNGLIPFLDELKKNDIPRAIATSAPRENVDFTVEKTGISSYFDIILDESHVSVGKPDPEIYLKTAGALKYDPANCIVIEDSLSGVESAKRAGCKVIGITTTHAKEEFNNVDLVIDDFSGLTLDQLSDLICTSIQN